MDPVAPLPHPPFDALVFDLGGVIVAHDNELLLGRLAAHCSGDDALSQLRAQIADPRIGTGARSIAALHRALCDELGYRRGWEAFRADWSSHFTVDSAMLALVTALAGRMRVMIFSNTNREHWDYLVAATGGTLGRIEAYLSHEIGMVKPSPAAFSHVAERAGIEPGRALFIDDLPENVAGARTAGFQGHVFTGRDELLRALHGSAQE